MPTGYASRGLTYSKKLGRWVKKETEKAFDYDDLNHDAAGFAISFFRWYPDYFADLCRSETARYKLELPQRLMMRELCRYRNVYITGCRGITKTYCLLLTKMIKGILWPGIPMRYIAPNQRQAANLATQAFHQIEKDYPVIAMHWAIRNERDDMFRITTEYGSEFTMYSPRGDNCGETIAEEIGQEGKDAFDMDKYEQDVLPTCRIERMVNQQQDVTIVQLQHGHISNACSRTNRAFSVHRAACLDDMQHGDTFDGYVMDMSFICALMGNIRSIDYIKDQRKKLSESDWKREMCALYTGSSDDPLIPDSVLSASRRNMLMEEEHCGDPSVIYIVAHDVSYVDDSKNAKCADVVWKLTPFNDEERRDKYRKQLVWADSYAPPKTDVLQARKVRELWRRFCLDGGNVTYLVIDAQAYGTGVVEELMKPTNDGSRPLCCVNHMAFQSIEQPGSIPVIYPMKATANGGTDADGDMISYAQVEFSHGNVELLTSDLLAGIEAYRNKHGIKDARRDAAISLPYRQCDLLCQQIGNLKVEASGVTVKERRKSKGIQRDIWSAAKYGLRMAQHLESDQKREKYGAKSSWTEKIEEVRRIMASGPVVKSGGRAVVLAMRTAVRRK